VNHFRGSSGCVFSYILESVASINETSVSGRRFDGESTCHCGRDGSFVAGKLYREILLKRLALDLHANIVETVFIKIF